MTCASQTPYSIAGLQRERAASRQGGKVRVDWTWVEFGHKILRLGWVVLGRVGSRVKISTKYTMYTQETEYLTNYCSLLQRSCNIAIYYHLIIYSNIKDVLFAVARETMMLASEVRIKSFGGQAEGLGSSWKN